MRLHLLRLATLGLACMFLGAADCPAEELPAHARAIERELRERVLPYWYDTAQDRERGGYLLADDQRGRRVPQEKQLVTQSRMIWTFSHVHRKGFGDGTRNYRQAAEQGYQFLIRHFLDPVHGGYYWKTDLEGKPVNERKILYGQAFVVYALVEYHRASGDRQALGHAYELYRELQNHAHDRKHGGWLEHFSRDWRPILLPEPGAEVEVPGLKSANAHLHWMEALTELYLATGNAGIGRALAEALDLNATYFYPKRAGQSCFHRHRDWKFVAAPRSSGLSYGHNVEFAWLMLRAERALGRPLSWPHFYAHLDHALEYGYDHERGGLYHRGYDNLPATDTNKIWWVEAEMLAALTEALRHQRRASYERALDQLLHFIDAHQVDPADGVWLDTVAADGAPKNTAKAHQWKANYHDVRALVKFTELFLPAPQPAGRR